MGLASTGLFGVTRAGDLGWLARGQQEASFEEVAFGQKLNDRFLRKKHGKFRRETVNGFFAKTVKITVKMTGMPTLSTLMS